MLRRKFAFINGTAGILFVAATLLSSCTPPPHGSMEYTTAHPLKVVDRTFQMNVELTNTNNDLTPKNLIALGEFTRKFHRQGKSHLFVLTSQILNDPERLTVNASLERQLAQLGILQHQIISSKISPNLNQPAHTVILTFSGSIVKVPECGDWSGETGFNPTNMPTRNYGCSYQRNIGLMVSDPQDLIEPDSSLSTLDSSAIERIISQYRAGEPTSSEPAGTRVFEESE